MAKDRDDADEVRLGGRPVIDPLALGVARSRIAKALFEKDEQVRVGRYQLLQRAGAGGMGTVWSAWDPELERRVAIKVMHVKSEAARTLLLREGQALAKLSHPNIVAIYDVGTFEQQVYLVMEWIAGDTLRTHASTPRTSRELVALYLAAGAGIAAAHRAGIVHRDFKPDNVMLGADGRVRVLDFGLARPSEAASGVAGTRRYMAPEQAAGAAATPAADQYSFAVSLREAFSTRGMPAWIASIVERATSEDPAARFPDMAALHAALARDPAVVWRRRGLAVVAAAGLVGAFAIGTSRHAPDVCGVGGSALAEVWNPGRLGKVISHVRTLGGYGASNAASLAGMLDAYGTRWTTAREDACQARQRDDLTEPLYEKTLACLERARAALDAVATTLSRTSEDKLADAIRALRELPAAERCRAEATTDPVPPPPPHLASRVTELAADATRARFLAFGADPDATALARRTAIAADTTGYQPVIARAQLALGAALEAAQDDQTAPTYGKAAEAALAGGDDVMFVEAFARRLYVAASLGDGSLAAALPIATTIARRTGASGASARALLFNNAATARLAAGDEPGAIELLRTARRELSPAMSSSEPFVILGNLAMLVSDRAERDALFAEERAELERTLGAEHQFTLAARVRAALLVEDPRRSTSELRELCAVHRRLHPHSPISIDCHYDLGWLAVERGDVVEAKAAYGVVAAAQEGPRSAIATAELARLAGDRSTTRVDAIARASAAEPAWWARLPAADAYAIAAAIHGSSADGHQALRAARAILGEALGYRNATHVRRRYIRATALLALATRDRALAAEAISWYRTAGGYDRAIAELAAI